jgi:hypothetical protein
MTKQIPHGGSPATSMPLTGAATGPWDGITAIPHLREIWNYRYLLRNQVGCSEEAVESLYIGMRLRLLCRRIVGRRKMRQICQVIMTVS